MTVLYTAREPFNRTFPKEGLTWDEFKVWNGFYQMTELLSLDQFLNAELEIFKNEVHHSFSYYENVRPTGFYTSLEHVVEIAAGRDHYNLLAVVKDPQDECKELNLDGFEFVGYDLIDRDYGYSALSNLGSILSPIVTKDLNEFGLIQYFPDAKTLQEKISTLYAGLDQAQTFIMAIWRHERIGRQSFVTRDMAEIAF